MSRLSSSALILVFAAACGDDGPGPENGPTTTTAVTVTCAGTLFISGTVQCEARATLSDGTSHVSSNATWRSMNPAVATVSQSGLVTAVAAGQATITADVNPQGALPIRVFPNFDGSWAGNEVFQSCEDSGTFEGFCGMPGFGVGDVFAHRSSFSQNQASVDATISTGPTTAAEMTGTIEINGVLRLPSAPSVPADPNVNAVVQNWSSRADTPGHMTGSFEAFFTVPGLPGSVTVVARLENVVKTSATSVLSTRTTTQAVMSRLAARVEALR